MKSFWHALSSLIVPGLGCYASPKLINMILAGDADAELLYGGDRMWPAVRSGQMVRIAPISADQAKPGMTLVVLAGRIPDLLRFSHIRSDGMLIMRADADPNEIIAVRRDGVLARAFLRSGAVRQELRLLRRLRLDLAEAWSEAPDEQAGHDPAETVRQKYDSQAAYYADSSAPEISGQLLGRIEDRVPRGDRLLVVGSGSGKECYALHKAGYRVKGVDFSPAMIKSAASGARERGLEIDFSQVDILKHHETPRSLGGVLFTYSVYSFLPHSRERIELLRNMARWIAYDGVIFLSARFVHRLYERFLLTLQWFRNGAFGNSAWGDCHTRYLTPDGALHRSFVHCFTLNQIRREVRAAGLTADVFQEGHSELYLPDSTPMKEQKNDETA